MILFAICSLHGGSAIPARAVVQPAPSPTPDAAKAAQHQPDVQLLIAPLDASGTAGIALTYPGVVTTREAQADLESIVRQTRWAIQDRQLTINRETTPDRPAMSSIEFTAANAVPGQSGALPVEALITALKAHKSMSLIFAMRPEFQFAGLRDFENDFVRIQFRESGKTYTYYVEVKNSDFEKLNLPIIVQQGEVPQRTAAGPAFLIPLIISAGVGAAVWFIVQTTRTRRSAS